MGIPKLSCIFDPFNTTKQPRQMKILTPSEVAAKLKPMGYRPSTRAAECYDFANAMHKTTTRVWLTDEGSEGQYLRTEVMIQTSPGTFETVVTLNSFATMDMILDAVRSVGSLSL